MIWKGIKLEFYRAFHSVWYVVALLIATAIVLVQFFTQVVPLAQAIGSGYNIDYPHSVFNTALMYMLNSHYSYIFYYSIILIAALPHTVSYFSDIKDGYIKNITTRMDRKGYLVGKYLAVFVSSGSICIIPLIINIYLTAMIIPSLIPQCGTHTFPVTGSGRCFAEGLFRTYPYLYTLLYLVIDFFITGLYNCIALAVSSVVNNRYIVMFLPFLIFIVFQTVIIYTPLALLAPYCIMDASQLIFEDGRYIIAEIMALLLITTVGFKMAGGKKRDVL